MDLIKRNELKLNDLTNQINTLKTKSNHEKYVPFEDLHCDFFTRSKLYFNPMKSFNLHYTVLEMTKLHILAEKLKLSEETLINEYFKIGKRQNLFSKDLMLYEIIDVTSQKNIQSGISAFSYTYKALKQIAIPNYYLPLKINYVNHKKNIKVKAKLYTTIDISTLTALTKAQYI
ncbi:MAG TPA: hypothetical protein DG048_18850 [Pseudoalteromonas sp.]|nr:hypothetical protein [Pseudoalteromonas sp.]|tara:strand:+ start:235 stop:756 length:522 start_codon:yes stop_codon:yes gene_type:complete